MAKLDQEDYYLNTADYHAYAMQQITEQKQLVEELGLKAAVATSARNGRVSSDSIAASTRERAVDHRRDGGRDRHLDFLLACELDQRARRERALGELAVLRAALAERDAEREIARLRRRAGEDEIAEPRKAGQRLGARAERAAEARKLRKAARHQRCGRARAELAAGHDAGRDREHVLGRAADLDAAHVGRVIGAEGRRAERARERGGGRFIRAGERHGGRQPARHVVGEARAGEDRGRRVRQRLGDHLGHELARAALDPLGAGDDRHAGTDMRRERRRGGARGLRRHHQQHGVRLRDLRDGAGRGDAVVDGATPGKARVRRASPQWRRRSPGRAPTSVTSRPARAALPASAVPHAPAPITAMR